MTRFLVRVQGAQLLSYARPRGRAFFVSMERIAKYDAYRVPTPRIYVDLDFNCRLPFTLESVQSLADNIRDNDLEIPVVLQRVSDMDNPISGFDFRLVAGFRRYFAMVYLLKWTEIPANIREGMTDRQAEILNLTENLERRDLNPLEEAQALARRFPPGTPLRTIAKAVNRDKRWVSQRLHIMELAEQLRPKVAAKMLTLLDVEMLVKLPPERQIEGANELIAARGKNKHKLKVNPEFRRKFREKRGKEEVNRRIAQLLQLGLGGLATRFGAWFVGYISDEDFDGDIRLALKSLDPKSAQPAFAG